MKIYLSGGEREVYRECLIQAEYPYCAISYLELAKGSELNLPPDLEYFIVSGDVQAENRGLTINAKKYYRFCIELGIGGLTVQVMNHDTLIAKFQAAMDLAQHGIIPVIPITTQDYDVAGLPIIDVVNTEGLYFSIPSEKINANRFFSFFPDCGKVFAIGVGKFTTLSAYPWAGSTCGTWLNGAKFRKGMMFVHNKMVSTYITDMDTKELLVHNAGQYSAMNSILEERHGSSDSR